MKKIFTLFTFIAIVSGSVAQTNVYLKINHRLGSNNFAFNTTATNDLGDSFDYTRLQYYISEIKLTYDGGQDTLLSDTYLLVEGSQHVNKLLGSFAITNLESIEFGIGVDANHNHLDPTTYPSGHPLALHNPTMHWGWAAGYRFIAIEGMTGPGMNQIWQLHALGDQNYGYVNVTTTGVTNGNDLIIALDADYEKALKGINVNSNLNYHGEGNQVPKLFQNFHQEVFSVGTPWVGLPEVKTSHLTMAPNPTTSTTHVTINHGTPQGTTLMVMDITGRKVLQREVNNQTDFTISLDRKGVYLVSLLTPEGTLESRKLIVQ